MARGLYFQLFDSRIATRGGKRATCAHNAPIITLRAKRQQRCALRRTLSLYQAPTRRRRHRRLQQAAIDNQNVFEVLLDAVRCRSPGQITNALLASLEFFQLSVEGGQHLGAVYPLRRGFLDPVRLEFAGALAHFRNQGVGRFHDLNPCSPHCRLA